MQAESRKSAGFGAGRDRVEPDRDSVRIREQQVRADFWDKVRRFAGKIPFVDDLVAAYYCALDPATPLRVRGMLLGALTYFILPFDAVPDFIAGLGLTDDAAVIAAVVSLVSQHIKPVHREAAARALGKEPPGGEDAG